MGCLDDEGECRNERYNAATLVGDLYRYCYSGVDRSGDSVAVLLYLDTINLPTNNGGNPGIMLSSLETTPVAGRDRLGFEYDGSLPAEIDPGIVREVGWKVKSPAAAIRYCESCITECGLAPIIYLEGRVEELRFLYDPGDTMSIYIRHLGLH